MQTIRLRASWIIGWLLVAGVLVSCGGGGGSAPPPAATLAAPVNFTVDARDDEVVLKWSDIPGATAFSIYYGTSPGITKSSTKIANVHSIYVVTNLTPGSTYYFAVAATNAGTEGALSREVSSTPIDPPPQPAPADVGATAMNGKVELSWVPGWDGTNDPTTYTIYYATTPHPTKASALKLANAVSPQQVGGLANDTTYYFVLTSTNAVGESGTSFEVSATPKTSPLPAAPSGFAAVEGNGAVTLSWNPVAGATSYNIYYGTEYGVNKSSGTKVTGVTSPHVLSGLSNKTGYFFIVAAVGSGGEGPEAAQTAATPLAATPIQAMLSIPGGTFQMGDNVQDPNAPAPYARPVHTVTVSAFSLARYETTFAEWKSVYDWALTHGYSFDNAGSDGGLEIGTNMPVTQISWNDVVKWLNARSEKEGRNPVYFTDASRTKVWRKTSDLPPAEPGDFQGNLRNASVDWAANGYRLATDAEWEWAARGGVANKLYPWGDVLDASLANFDRGTTTSVGSYPANNAYGLFDMAGNVWEWTWDHGSDTTVFDPAAVTNPHGPETGLFRIRRGGSYVYGTRYLRNFDKMFRSQGYRGQYFGFRVASSQP